MHSLNYTYIITHCASAKNVNSEPQWARMALIAGQKSVKFTLTFFFSRHGFFQALSPAGAQRAAPPDAAARAAPHPRAQPPDPTPGQGARVGRGRENTRQNKALRDQKITSGPKRPPRCQVAVSAP